MNEQIQQSNNPSLPAATGVSMLAATGVFTSTSTILSSFEDANSKKEAAKNRLRAAWNFGDDWRLNFGRELRISRDDIPHGEWNDFLQEEFGLHRQTAWNWMRKAAEADGVSLDQPQTNTDEPDEHAEAVTSLIDEEREKVNEARDINLNGPKPYRILLDGVTEDEKELFKAEMKKEREWVQQVLRDAFNTVVAGKPVVRTGKKLETMPEADDDVVEVFCSVEAEHVS